MTLEKFADHLVVLEDVLVMLKHSPAPMFQTLCLTDLPSELLDLTFRFIPTRDARALSSTCHMLNGIGRPHIFRHRKLRLHLSPNIRMNVEYSDIDLPAVAQYARKDLLKDIHFIMGCPPVRTQIQSLLITDEWWPRGRVLVPENGDHRNPFLLDEGFYRPIYEHFLMTLQCVPRLTELTLSNLDITRDFLITVSAAPSLNTLSLEFCRVPTIVQACILLNRLPTSSSLANLNILIDPDAEETRTQWYALMLFPRIRTLSVGGVGQASFPLPDPGIRGRCHLPYLERLSLHDFDPSEIDSFSSWLRTIGSPSGLRLTHFKLHSSWGISDASILSLLRSLEAAPLEVLVIEGLANAEFALFDCISVLFPQLVALTLARRQNSYQLENRAVAWPHASWEYAQRLKTFRRLRHFCWNFFTVYYDATPAPLLAIESDFEAAGDDDAEEGPYTLWIVIGLLYHSLPIVLH
ncbi:hypothetical protein BDQ17DRAFT_1321942 [Cyathus striatus]|nr:hypothetical protein BDQ17DRAFT_1321942 [Cyathus striatus]